MSGKLDQSLDEILSTQRKAGGRRGRNPARRASGRIATTAPVGGVQKNSKKPQAAAKQAPAKASGGPGDSKVVVSNLVSTGLHPFAGLLFFRTNINFSPRM
jgi:THO complex subunit 4